MFAFNFVLFGDYSKYIDKLIMNINWINKNIDNCTFHVNCVLLLNKDVKRLKKMGCRIYIRDNFSKCRNTKLMLLRYFPINNPENYPVLIRDADSLVTKEEIFMINHWIKSRYSFMVIRDSIAHTMPIMGGLFGYKAQFFEFIEQYLQSIDEYPFDDYGADQKFLSDNLYVKIRNQTLFYTSSITFPYENFVSFSSKTERLTIGGYGTKNLSNDLYTMLPHSLFKLLRYKGSSLKIKGAYFGNCIEKLIFE